MAEPGSRLQQLGRPMLNSYYAVRGLIAASPPAA